MLPGYDLLKRTQSGKLSVKAIGLPAPVAAGVTVVTAATPIPAAAVPVVQRDARAAVVTAVIPRGVTAVIARRRIR